MGVVKRPAIKIDEAAAKARRKTSLGFVKDTNPRRNECLFDEELSEGFSGS
jgi:hypothetical protein